MRLPRMTTRRWMVAVSVVALILGASKLAVRRAMLVGQSRVHAAWLRDYRANLAAYDSGLIQYRNATPEFIRGYGDALRRKIQHHERLVVKYEHAARYPWLPVEPDRPEPE